MKLLKSQRGAVDLVVGVLLVGLLVIGGVYFYYKHQTQLAADAAKLANQATQQTVKKGKPAPDPTATWTSYSNAAGKFSLKYDPTWKTLVCDDKATTYLAPSAAALAKCNSDYGGQMHIISVDGDMRDQYDMALSAGTDKASTAVTVSGVTGTRTALTVDADSAIGPVKGSKIVQYMFFTGGRTYILYYQQAPSGDLGKDVLSDFDLMVKTTLKFS